MSEEAQTSDPLILDQLIDSTQDAVIFIGEDAKIVRFNATAESMFGYRADEVLGKNVSCLMPEPYRAEHDGYLTHYRRTGEKRAIGKIREVTARGADGKSFPIELSVTEIKEVPGVSYAAFIRDVSRLRLEELRLQRLIALTQDAVIFVNRQREIVSFNASAEKIFGWSFEEVEGKNVKILMPEFIADQHDSFISNYEATGDSRAVDHIRSVSARRKDGEGFPIEISVTRIDDDQDVAYAAFVRDVSERARLHAELVDRERLAAIGTTAATFAHEIGNPLNSMYMNAQLLERRLLKERTELSPRVATRVHAISDGITRLNLLLREFRALSRRQQLDISTFDLAAYVRTLLDQDAPSHAAANVEVEFSTEPQSITVQADRTKIAQVFLNLTKNAVEAMPEGGLLHVRLTHVDKHARLEIEDKGVGIDPSIDVFAPFASTKPEGTGLGLAVVQRIVAEHNGSISYRSAPAQGTTFVIELPKLFCPPSE